jgi:short-subunit dehydrogenase
MGKPSMALTGKRIILTGGSGGLGKLVAAELLREGADLTVVSRTWIGRGDDRVRHIAVDLSTANGIDEASSVVAREEPDVLINMAGVQYFGPAESQSFEEMHNGYMVNLVAPAALCRACLSAMKRRNAGQIANIGSIVGSPPWPTLQPIRAQRPASAPSVKRCDESLPARKSPSLTSHRAPCERQCSLLKFSNTPR